MRVAFALLVLTSWGCGASETEDQSNAPVVSDSADEPVDASGTPPDVGDDAAGAPPRPCNTVASG